MRLIAHLCSMFARAYWGPSGYTGHHPSDCFVFDFKSLTSELHLIESPLCIFIRGFE